jgi:hypothetical protein
LGSAHHRAEERPMTQALINVALLILNAAWREAGAAICLTIGLILLLAY